MVPAPSVQMELQRQVEVLGTEKRRESEAAAFAAHELQEAMGLVFEVRAARDVAEATLQVGRVGGMQRRHTIERYCRAVSSGTRGGSDGLALVQASFI